MISPDPGRTDLDPSAAPPLVDRLGRAVTYLRLSVTDRSRADGDARVLELIRTALSLKPEGHAFRLEAGRVSGITPHMSTLGG